MICHRMLKFIIICLTFMQDYGNFRQCAKTTPKCEKLSPAKCFGSPLKYTHTAVGTFVPLRTSKTTGEVEEWGANTQQEAHQQLEKWQKYLKPFPACWKKVQPFLCSMYLPPCVNDSLQVRFDAILNPLITASQLNLKKLIYACCLPTDR